MKTTSLHDIHEELGARMVEFGGWHMPVQYGPILEEGKTVRSAAGLFDLGHMGRFHVRGPEAVRLVDRVSSNHVAKVKPGGIRYSLLLNEEGYPLDDFLFYVEEDGVYLVVNASNTERDLEWIRSHTGDLDAELVDETEATGMIALQGPASADVLAKVTDLDLDKLGYYRFAFGTVCGMAGTRVSRTGYTGEDGFEIYFPTEEAPRVWNELSEAGAPLGLKPIGLGARDILRLEAGMALYGHELDLETDPLAAGVDFAISLTEAKGDFIGRAALEARKGRQTERLVGIVTDGKRAPRQGYTLFAGDQEVGRVVSGGVSPTLGKNIGSAYVRLGHDGEGTELSMDIRGKRQATTVCELPFYSRTRKKKSS
ncbi:MAG TPA: glycine cleavage system aminomethyltransferase GcvT [Planctomycetes bacterium]|nr:glycine cleavage system aminomethyltransferase GcvT [Planctomycetota bacterium]